MLPVDVLKLALSKETKAIEFYQKLIADHPNMKKDILYYLLTEEQKHRALIEKKINEFTRD